MFKELGYFKEYYKDGKLIGIVNCEKDRDTIGYLGRAKETPVSNIVLTNKKKAKENIEYTTILYPICGRLD